MPGNAARSNEASRMRGVDMVISLFLSSGTGTAVRIANRRYGIEHPVKKSAAVAGLNKTVFTGD